MDNHLCRDSRAIGSGSTCTLSAVDRVQLADCTETMGRSKHMCHIPVTADYDLSIPAIAALISDEAEAWEQRHRTVSAKMEELRQAYEQRELQLQAQVQQLQVENKVLKTRVRVAERVREDLARSRAAKPFPVRPFPGILELSSAVRRAQASVLPTFCPGDVSPSLADTQEKPLWGSIPGVLSPENTPAATARALRHTNTVPPGFLLTFGHKTPNESQPHQQMVRRTISIQ